MNTGLIILLVLLGSLIPGFIITMTWGKRQKQRLDFVPQQKPQRKHTPPLSPLLKARAKRDALKPMPVMVLPAEAKCMLVGDSKGYHFVVDPQNMREVTKVEVTNSGYRHHRYGRPVTLDLDRRKRH